VTVEEMREKPERELLVIRATILVDRTSHKGIVIGAGGQQLREIGRRARQELEALFGVRVFLELFVRVEAGWAKNPRRLRELGL
jgi:GTP-binding protein Era